MSRLNQYLPIFDWARHYDRNNLPSDVMAGLITAIMLVPQSMAYALLAGLPPETGLYSAILPIMLYAIFGTSRTLAVGPVAIVSLMVASTLGGLYDQGTADYLTGAITLAFMVGVISVAMGLLRVGFIINFLSHPVIAGFTSAASLVIAFSQLKHLLGIGIPRSHLIHETVFFAFDNISQANWFAIAIGGFSIALLLFARGPLKTLLGRFPVPEPAIEMLSKSGPLLAVIISVLLVQSCQLDTQQGVRIVGEIPAGLPGLTLPSFDIDLITYLLPAAFLISFVGYMESVSVAKALASKRREKIDPNQELLGLGAANLAASVTGAYPVTGGFSRSVVNFTAGAVTPLASIITAILVAVSVLLFTPLFYFLPKAVLAAIIMVAIFSLVDVGAFIRAWKYNKADAAALAATFFAVLSIGIELGILVGVAISIIMYLWRTSRPHIAIVGRMPGTEHYRNIDRQRVELYREVVLFRVDENLFFANARFLEDWVLKTVADQPEIRHLVLICSAINSIDTSALESLEEIVSRLRDSGVTLHLAEVKGPVMDRLKRTNFIDELGEGRIFLSTHQAMDALVGDGTQADLSSPSISS